MRFFVSSTCYDLLDLRAELEAFFRQAGIEPVMSDSLTSDFQVSPDRNSIETCLANVRTCDHFIIILSNRYGPSLEKAGFPDISATHLEYLEARKHNIPIHMYVRDRLEADFAIWKTNRANPDLKLTWCKSTTDWKIFELVGEHRKLKDAGGNNWFWIFRNSIELKERIRLDFKEPFANAAVRALFNAGNLPLLEIHANFRSYDWHNLKGSIDLRNVGQGTAVSPEFHVVDTQNRWKLPTLHSGEKATIDFQWALQPGTGTDLKSALTYSTLQGYKFTDEGALSIWARIFGANELGMSYTLKERCYVGTSDAALLMIPSFGGTKSKT